MFYTCLQLLPLTGYDTRIKGLLMQKDGVQNTYNGLELFGQVNGKSLYGNIAKFYDVIGGFTLDEIGVNDTPYKYGFTLNDRLVDMRSGMFLTSLFTDGTVKNFLPKRGVARKTITANQVIYRLSGDITTEKVNNVIPDQNTIACDSYFNNRLDFTDNENLAHGTIVSYQGADYYVVSRELINSQIVCSAVGLSKGDDRTILATPVVGADPEIVRNSFGYSLKWKDGRCEFTSLVEGFADGIVVTFPVPFISIKSVIPNISRANGVNNYTYIAGIGSVGFVFISNTQMTSNVINGGSSNNKVAGVIKGFWK